MSAGSLLYSNTWGIEEFSKYLMNEHLRTQKSGSHYPEACPNLELFRLFHLCRLMQLYQEREWKGWEVAAVRRQRW